MKNGPAGPFVVREENRAQLRSAFGAGIGS